MTCDECRHAIGEVDGRIRCRRDMGYHAPLEAYGCLHFKYSKKAYKKFKTVRKAVRK